MNYFKKILFVIYCVIFFGLVGLLIYINFINTDVYYVSNKQLIPVILAFLYGIVKSFNKNADYEDSLKFYKDSYSDILKDSFESDKKSLNNLLKALRLYNENKYDKSIEILDGLLGKCQSINEKYSVLLFKALNYSDSNRFDEAIEVYENMILFGLGDSRVLSNLMNRYNYNGEFDKACELGHQAISIDPRNCAAYNNLAYLYFNDGNYDEALKYANQCLEIKSNFIQAITLLFIIYSLQGNSEQVEIYRKKAVANGRSNAELQEILEQYL